MLHIYIDTVPHATHRYPTVGDYFDVQTPQMKAQVRNIRVSDMQNVDYEFLVAIHEMIEQHLCKNRGIAEETITAFDIAFENARAVDNTDEPGDSPLAPYQKEHQFATQIERLVAAEIDIDWDAYDATVNSL
jgi:hypothetical protein